MPNIDALGTYLNQILCSSFKQKLCLNDSWMILGSTIFKNHPPMISPASSPAPSIVDSEVDMPRQADQVIVGVATPRVSFLFSHGKMADRRLILIFFVVGVPPKVEEFYMDPLRMMEYLSIFLGNWSSRNTGIKPMRNFVQFHVIPTWWAKIGYLRMAWSTAKYGMNKVWSPTSKPRIIEVLDPKDVIGRKSILGKQAVPQWDLSLVLQWVRSNKMWASKIECLVDIGIPVLDDTVIII